MKKIFTLLLIQVLWNLNTNGQVLMQDAEGKSSVLYQGNALNIDIAESRVSFSLNSYANESSARKEKSGFWGIQAAADSKNGLANRVYSD